MILNLVNRLAKENLGMSTLREKRKQSFEMLKVLDTDIDQVTATVQKIRNREQKRELMD
mgnify:CR=1 FL=1